MKRYYIFSKRMKIIHILKFMPDLMRNSKKEKI